MQSIRLHSFVSDTFLLPGGFTVSPGSTRAAAFSPGVVSLIVRFLHSRQLSCENKKHRLLEPRHAGEWHARCRTSARRGSREVTPSAARGEGGSGDRDAQRWNEINEVLMWAVRSLKADSRCCNRGRVVQNVPLCWFPTLTGVHMTQDKKSGKRLHSKFKLCNSTNVQVCKWLQSSCWLQ